MRNDAKQTDARHNFNPSPLIEGRARARRGRRLPIAGSRASLLAIGLAAGALAAGGGYALASSAKRTIHGCLNNRSHALTVQRRCARGTRALVWDQTGPRGLTGKTGKTGATGPVGPTGATGPQGPAGALNLTVDQGDVGGGLVPRVYAGNGGIVAVSHVATGVYQVTASGCGHTAAIAQVTVVPNFNSSNPNYPERLDTASVQQSGSAGPGEPEFIVRITNFGGWDQSTGAYTPASSFTPDDINDFDITVTC